MSKSIKGIADKVFQEYEKPVCIVVSSDLKKKIDKQAKHIPKSHASVDVSAFMGVSVYEDPELPADTLETYYDRSEAAQRVKEIQ